MDLFAAECSVDLKRSVHKDRAVVRQGMCLGDNHLYAGSDIEFRILRNGDRTVKRDILRYRHGGRARLECRFQLFCRCHIRPHREIARIVYKRAGAIPASDNGSHSAVVFKRTGHGHLRAFPRQERIVVYQRRAGLNNEAAIRVHIDGAVVCKRLALRHGENPVIADLEKAFGRDRQIVGERDGRFLHSRRHAFYGSDLGKQRADIRFRFRPGRKPHQLHVNAGQAGVQIDLAHIENQVAGLAGRIGAVIMEAAALGHGDHPVVLQRTAVLDGDAAAFDININAFPDGECALLYAEMEACRKGEVGRERYIAHNRIIHPAIGNGSAQLLFDGKGRSFDGHGLFAVNFGAVSRSGADNERTGGSAGAENRLAGNLRKARDEVFTGDDRPLHACLPHIVREDFRTVRCAAAGEHGIRAVDRNLFGQHALGLVRDAVGRQRAALK